jgi:glycosyltransferase involved in cell wall biosynthesis
VAIAATRRARGAVAVFYGRDSMPREADVVSGGMVKLVQLARRFPNDVRAFNVLYLGSSSLPRDATMLARLARLRGAAFVLNQDGVAYPAWHGPGWEEANRVPARLFHAAEHVVFQSAFCKLAAERYLGVRTGSWEILHNPVDTARFSPAPNESRPFTLLLGGSRYQQYPVELALRTLALVRRERGDARLVVAGAFTSNVNAATSLIRELGLVDAVELAGAYARRDAPALFRRADVLLHPKVNDPCPTTVLEAMASGVPVVFSATGGTAELVGEDGGVGVPGELDWEHDRPPVPEELAAALLQAAEVLPELRASARERAVSRFDVGRWLARHEELFEVLTAGLSR